MSYSRLAVLVALVVGGVGFVLWLLVKPQLPKRGRERETAPAQVEVPRPFLLPVKTVDATRLLGHSRDEVRRVLGAPVEELAGLDRFERPAPLRVRYEGGVAVGLQVTAARAGDHVDLVRRWLKLPPAEPMLLDGDRYEIGPVEDDPDTVQVLRVARAAAPVAAPRVQGVASAPKKEPAPGGVVLAAEAMRAFPLIPPDLSQRCRKLAQGGATELLCSRGVDAKLAYEQSRGASSLTVLGPPGASSLDACRGWLQRVVSGAAPTGSSRAEDELLEQYRKGDVRYAMRWLTVDLGGGGERCTISACTGGASACR